MSTDTTTPISESSDQSPETPTPTAPAAGSVESSTGAEAGSEQKIEKIKKPKLTLIERAEAFISNLSTRNNFWNRVCSMIWLPYAFRSGITMQTDASTYRATLPFRRFNKNWYNAMAGAALLGNSEIAGGNYVFAVCGGDYTVVCKHLEYKFLRPCHGPAEYRMTALDDIHALVESGDEFNIAVRMDIVQVLVPMSEKKLKDEVEQQEGNKPAKPKRVGRCTATFHVTPKAHHKAKKLRGSESK
ncbi:MAG: hypothetical protein JKX70_09070 [Phycisphaerales bacterium]|nr:hypothetical protein [Phycisphaerales bacterium]